MAEIAKGWIQVIPSFKGMKEGITKELGGADAFITSASTGWGERIKGAFGGALKTVGTGLVATFATATAGVLSYTGEAVRASDATEKFMSTLKFAGLDTKKIDELRKSTQKYADQTVYELADIQNTTAQLAANGVEGYDRLAMAAGNLNAVAGGNVQTYKSVGQVITQTAGAGKLMTENWRQLTDAIPGAAGRLKNALKEVGAYTGDFMKAMSDGQISAEEFNQAILSLGFEEAAVEAATSTKTFENAWGNIEAAITGGLVKIIEPLKGPATAAMARFAENMTNALTVVAGAIEIFLKGDFNPATWGEGIEEDSPIIDFLFNIRDNATLIMNSLAPIIGGLSGAFGPLLSTLPIVGGMFTGLTGPVGLVIGFVTQMITNSEALQVAFGGAFTQISGSLSALSPVLQTILASTGHVATMLGDALAPVVTTLGQVFSNLIVKVGPKLGALFALIGRTISALMPTIKGIISTVILAIQNVLPIVVTTLTSVIDTLISVGNAILPVIQYIGVQLIPIIQGLLPVVTEVFGYIGAAIQSAMDVIHAVISTVTALISGDWAGVWNGIKDIFSGVWELIKSLLGAGWEFIKGLFNTGLATLSALWNSLWDTLGNALSSAWESIKTGVSTGISNVIDYFTNLPSRILGALGDVGTMLWDAGASVIQGFLDGISSMFGAVKDKLSTLTSWLPDWKGPAEVDAKILYGSGELVIGGFTEGLEDKFKSSVRPLLNGFTREVGNTAFSPLGVAATSVAQPMAVYVQNPFTGDYLLAQVDSHTDGKLAGASRLRLREYAGI